MTVYALPDRQLITEAAAYVRDIVDPQIFNHSVRTYLLGREAARRDGSTDIDEEALCLAALFHDIGTADAFDGPERFEIESADAAEDYLRDRGWDSTATDVVWQAIALHTSPGIAERRGPVPHYLRRGVQIEFGSAELRRSYRHVIDEVESRYARAGLERRMRSLLLQQATAQPQKALRPSWVADLLRGDDPHFVDDNATRGTVTQ